MVLSAVVSRRESSIPEVAQTLGSFLPQLKAIVGTARGAIGFSILVTWTLVALAAPILAPYDPVEMHPGDELQSPSAAYIFGTDQYGRDLMSRVAFGARITLRVGVISVGSAAFAGVTLGLIAGFFGKFISTVLMRSSDIALAFPSILVGIAVASVLGSGTFAVITAVAIVSVPVFTRMGHALMVAEKQKEYVLASIACGATNGRLIFRTILPNCVSPILAQIAVAMASAMLLEAALSFLGLGAQPPTPSWGLMLSRSRPYLSQAPWWAFFPGLSVTSLVLGLNQLSEAIQNALSPTSRG